MKYQIQACDCETCDGAEKPCHNDCDRGPDACEGCQEIHAESDDVGYAIDVARGVA